MKLATIALCWLLVGWVFTRYQLPGNSLLMNSLQNSGHGIVFFIGTLLTLCFVKAHKSKERLKPILLLALVLLLGATVEIVQEYTGRGASLTDMMMNTSGAVAAFLVLLAMRTREFAISACAIGLSAILLSWCLYKPAIYLLSDALGRSLPVLADFETFASLARVKTINAIATRDDHSVIWSANSSQTLSVTFNPGRWPSLRFLEPHRDWSHYDRLTFQVMNPGNTAVPINVRVDDASIDFPDHAFMTVQRSLAQGMNTVSISFTELDEDASNRGAATFKEITQLMVFLPENRQDTTLVFDNFLLR